MLLQLERRPAACIVIRPLAECNVLSAPSVFTARRYAMSDYAMVALCLCVCSSQVAAEPITVVCKAARVVRGLNNGVMALFERFTVCSAKMAEPIDGKASNRLRYTLSVHIVRCKAADLCWRVVLSAELIHRQTDRQRDTRTWLYVPGPCRTYSSL